MAFRIRQDWGEMMATPTVSVKYVESRASRFHVDED
jgi:hypothetical protein